MSLTHRKESVPVYNSMPLRLSFSPEAIREHFGESEAVQGLDDEKLAEVAERALEDDVFYTAFDKVLRESLIAAGLTEEQIGE